MSDPRALERELQHHAVALRSIARDLLRDPHVAEDVAQDTLHRALAQRALRPGPLGGWLYRTLVNFAHQWRRGERRRHAREARVPAPEPAASPPDALGRRETLAAVTNAVLALDEPFQTAIFLRYFENLPPRVIARTTGANLATVKSRLQRGLVMLRARLDRHCGGDQREWRLALLCTFGLPVTSVAAGLTLTGAWLLGTTTKTLIAAGLLCAGGLYVYSLTQDPPPQHASHVVPREAADASLATSTTDGKQEVALREPIAAEQPVAAWLDHPYRFDLEVFVVDRFGLPVEGHSLRLSPPAGTMIDAPGASGSDGLLTMSWRSRLPEGAAVLVDERDTRRRVELRHGTKTRVTLLGTRSNGHGEMVVSWSRALAIEPRVRVLAGRSLLDQRSSGDPGTPPAGLHPYVVFDTAATKIEPPTPTAPEILTEISFDSSWKVRSVLGDALSIVSRETPEKSDPEASLASIAGTVFGEDGKPAAKVPVFLLGQGPQPVQQVETDDAGQFVFEQLLAAEFTVRAGGTDAGLATAPATTTTGTTPVTLNLRRGSCLRGKALAADGTPLRGATITWRAVDGTWCDETTSLDDGSFVIANLPGSAGTVLMWAPGDEHPLPVASVGNVLCDTGELVLRAEAAAASTLLVDPVLPDGIDGGVSVRLWNTDLGIATRVPDAEEGAPHRLAGLGAAWYRIEMHHATTGWFDAGRHWIDGKADCDLGHVLLPVPATVKFELDPSTLAAADQRAFEVCSLRRDVDVRYSGAEPADTLLLPGGDYVFAWRGDDGAVHFHRFTAIGGRKITVRPQR